MVYETNCDMGCIKIFNNTMSCFFNNGVGDVPTMVRIEKPKKTPSGADITEQGYPHFLGHFTVLTEAYLSDYDCGCQPIHKFKPGRYFVYQGDNAKMLILFTDLEIHS